MTQRLIYGAWFLLTVLAAIIIRGVRFRRTSKWNLQLNEVLDLALAVFGGVSGIYLMLQTWLLYDTLQQLLGNEGLVAMALGGLASLWFGVSKIRELAIKS